LPDVLRLLAQTKKSGRLRIDGARGTGSVWVDHGSVVAIEADNGGDAPVERMFELLRYLDGSFMFDAEGAHPQPEMPVDVEPLLAEAEALLSEWRVIETVVPSLASWVALVTELPAAQVTLDRSRWRTVTAIAGGSTVGDLGARLGLAEVPVSRMVKELVELGLADVTVTMAPASAAPAPAPAHAKPVQPQAVAPAAAEPAPPPRPAPQPEPAPMPEPAPRAEFVMPAATDAAFIDSSNPNLLPPAPWAEEAQVAEPEETLFESPAPAAASAESYDAIFPGLAGHSITDAPEPAADVAPEDADAVARQLANLSPRAAKAVRAAAAATTDEEREAALAAMPEDEEEPLNRGLLLKFLSSVRS
jgi:hypothetical protein